MKENRRKLRTLHFLHFKKYKNTLSINVWNTSLKFWKNNFMNKSLEYYYFNNCFVHSFGIIVLFVAPIIVVLEKNVHIQMYSKGFFIFKKKYFQAIFETQTAVKCSKKYYLKIQ